MTFCLIPNHVHIIGVPETEHSLDRAVKEVNRRYSCHINFQKGWRGFLWQGRFSSFPMDEPYFYHALHYVETNPVRARLVSRPEDWPWSSASHRKDASPSSFRYAMSLLPVVRVCLSRMCTIRFGSMNEPEDLSLIRSLFGSSRNVVGEYFFQ